MRGFEDFEMQNLRIPAWMLGGKIEKKLAFHAGLQGSSLKRKINLVAKFLYLYIGIFFINGKGREPLFTINPV